MTDETRDKLKDIVKKKPLQTAIITTSEYDSGFSIGRMEGYNQALDDLFKVTSASLGHLKPLTHGRVFSTEVIEIMKTHIEKLRK